MKYKTRVEMIESHIPASLLYNGIKIQRLSLPSNINLRLEMTVSDKPASLLYNIIKYTTYPYPQILY
jgi:hypothetical protein